VSRSFLGLPTIPLQVPIIGKPLLLAKKSSYPPTVVPIEIKWADIQSKIGGAPLPTDIGVSFNLLTGATKSQIDIIQSIFIDNTASPNSLYVHFPSTGMTISVAPATADWFPAITEDLLVQVFIIGLAAGQIPTTQIFFTNVLVNPFSDPEQNFAVSQGLVSAAVSRGNNIFNTNFGIPALGDQTINFCDHFAQNTGGPGTVIHDHLFNTPTTGFVYLTHADINALGNSGHTFSWSIDAVTSGGTVLYTFISRYPNQAENFLGLSGMNIKLDATLNWQMRVVANSLINANPNLQGADDAVFANTTLVWTNNPF
jgi:hypothetical protein